MAAFGEWRGPLYPPYQPLERPVSGYHGGLQMTQGGRSRQWQIQLETGHFLAESGDQTGRV